MKSGHRGRYAFIDERYGMDRNLRRAGDILGESDNMYVIEVPIVRDEDSKVICMVPKKFVDLVDLD